MHFASIHPSVISTELELDLLFGLDGVTNHCTSSFHSKEKNTLYSSCSIQSNIPPAGDSIILGQAV